MADNVQEMEDTSLHVLSIDIAISGGSAAYDAGEIMMFVSSGHIPRRHSPLVHIHV